MRRASTCLALLGLAVLARAAGAASARPTVKFKAKAVPIPGFPHTGNIFGAGAAVEAEYMITGTEYGGFPPPLTGVNFYLPTGTKLHPTGFPTCAPVGARTVRQGPDRLPEEARTPVPSAKRIGFVAFGSERVHETATIESFYAPGGGLTFFTRPLAGVAGNPVHGALRQLGGAAASARSSKPKSRWSKRCRARQDASVETIKVKAGSADQEEGKKPSTTARAEEVPERRLHGQDRTHRSPAWAACRSRPSRRNTTRRARARSRRSWLRVQATEGVSSGSSSRTGGPAERWGRPPRC